MIIPACKVVFIQMGRNSAVAVSNYRGRWRARISTIPKLCWQFPRLLLADPRVGGNEVFWAPLPLVGLNSSCYIHVIYTEP